MKEQPLVYIIMINHNSYGDTSECINSLKQISYNNYKSIVVDNGSIDNSFFKLRDEYDDVIFIRNSDNIGFSAGNNVGIRRALIDNPYAILLLNNDTIVTSNFLNNAVELLLSSNTIGIVGGKIYYYIHKDIIWAAGGKINWHRGTISGIGNRVLDKGQFDKIREVDYCPTTMALIKSDVFEHVGLLPECYFICYEEAEFSYRSQNMGHRSMYCPTMCIYHKVGFSSRESAKNIYNHYRNRFLFQKRNLSKKKWMIWSAVFCIYAFIKKNIVGIILYIFDRKYLYKWKLIKLAFDETKVKEKILLEDLISIENSIFSNYLG